VKTDQADCFDLPDVLSPLYPALSRVHRHAIVTTADLGAAVLNITARTAERNSRLGGYERGRSPACPGRWDEAPSLAGLFDRPVNRGDILLSLQRFSVRKNSMISERCRPDVSTSPRDLALAASLIGVRRKILIHRVCSMVAMLERDSPTTQSPVASDNDCAAALPGRSSWNRVTFAVCWTAAEIYFVATSEMRL
jgi:hypothetical protein